MNPSVSSNVWGEILHSLSGRLNHQTLERWFGPIQFESLDRAGQVIHLRAPNQVIKDWVVSNYSKLLDESLNDLSLNGYSLGWQIDRASESASTSTFTETVIETTTTSDRDIVTRESSAKRQCYIPVGAFAQFQVHVRQFRRGFM